MFSNITPETAIDFTRLSVHLNCCWPLHATATKFQILRFKILRLLSMISALMLLLPLLYGLYVHQNDLVVFSKVAGFVSNLIHVLLQTSVCIAEHDRLRALIQEMTECCQLAKSYERRVFQQYLDAYSTFYGVCASWFYVTAAVVVVGTVFLSQPFPTPAEYPFPVDYEPLRTIVFLHQSLVGMQCAATVCVNVFCALLMLFAAARFEILMLEMRAVRDVRALIKCVEKYYHVKRYAQKVASVVQYMDLVTVIMASLPLVLCGLNIIGRQTLMVKVQFLFLGGTASLAVFMCALPADHLMQVSENALRSLYEATWYDQAVGLQKTIVRAIVPLKPVTISIACVIPVLSLQYYCSYIANAFSLFTALRVVMIDEEE